VAGGEAGGEELAARLTAWSKEVYTRLRQARKEDFLVRKKKNIHKNL
jgi:hypothetical protein